MFHDDLYLVLKHTNLFCVEIPRGPLESVKDNVSMVHPVL